MAIAAFFGHRKSYFISKYRNKIDAIIIDLIENHGVTSFYNGFRGLFDGECAFAVADLKKVYPFIENVMVLSYIPDPGFELPECFDLSVYLLDKPVIPKFAIYHTNREIVKRADYIISGVDCHYGGAYTACEYARRLKKTIINIYDKNM